MRAQSAVGRADCDSVLEFFSSRTEDSHFCLLSSVPAPGMHIKDYPCLYVPDQRVDAPQWPEIEREGKILGAP